MEPDKYLLVISHHAEAQQTIQSALGNLFATEFAETLASGLARFAKRRYEFVFIDIDFLINSRTDTKSTLLAFWNVYPSVEIIVLCPPTQVREAVKAVKAGASDYLTLPLGANEVKLALEQINETIRLQSELDYLRDQFWRKESLSILRTNSAVMKDVFSKVRSVSQSDSTVLLTGETGTGKGVIANLIHQHSSRRDKQFISVHCGAIPDTLLESELFGHEKGAFTGAVRRKLGKFEIANTGTIFLDEIGTISSAMQIKLLKVLQDKTFQRVGGEGEIYTDVRIIAATNADLNAMVNEGTFRTDLYYRLNVFPIEIPPLREREMDVPLLVEQFLKKLNRYYGKGITEVEPKVLLGLQQYKWPGNIRELENIIERAYIIETSSKLTQRNFPAELFKSRNKATTPKIDTSLTLEQIRSQEVERIEQLYLKKQLANHRGKIKDTAQAAGLGVRQLHKLMRKYQIRKEEFKTGTVDSDT